MRHHLAFALLALCLPAALAAQQALRTVSPGMTHAQVVAALGAPATERKASEYTYMFYRNACGRACGMNDLVTLHGDSVVDAIFRSGDRHYSGTSSSPESVPPAAVAGKRTAPRTRATRMHPDSASKSTKPAAPAKSAAPAPTQMKPPARPNDAKPSIPLNEPRMQPAPAAAPATTKKPTT